MTALLRLTALGIAGWCLLGMPDRQRQVFRATADATSVHVSVRDRNGLVAGLTSADFEVLDNGVPQTIESVVVGTVPIDLTAVLDTSASMTAAAVKQFLDELRQMVGLLKPEDRIRILTFSTRVREAVPMQLAAQVTGPFSAEPTGATAFFNALVAALTTESSGERPHLVVALGDGGDNMGLIDATDVAEVARRSDAVLYVLLRGEWTGSGSGWLPYRGPGSLDPLKDAAIATGGAYERSTEVNLVYSGPYYHDPILPRMKRAIADFRASYMLWFKPTGVALPGWHDLTVRVTSGKYTVVARKGYFGR